MDKWTDSHPAAPGLAGLLTARLAEDTHGCRLSRRSAPLLAGPTAPSPRRAATRPHSAGRGSQPTLPSPSAAEAADKTLALQPTLIFVNYATVFEL